MEEIEARQQRLARMAASWRIVAEVERGRAVQVRPIKPTMKAPGPERLKLNNDNLLSTFAFSSTCAASARRYVDARVWRRAAATGECGHWH